jgi:hypothetical protein
MIRERQIALTELQREISGCLRCVEAGFIPVAHPIFRGGIEQRWMILGQAPGAAADTYARPYSGATGKTLRAWLARAGIDEATFYERFYLRKGASASSMAASIVVLAPIVILFFLTQKTFIQGITFTGLRG